ncbi:hypothetical protein RUND412_006507 [Rhizina undulata]
MNLVSTMSYAFNRGRKVASARNVLSNNARNRVVLLSRSKLPVEFRPMIRLLKATTLVDRHIRYASIEALDGDGYERECSLACGAFPRVLQIIARKAVALAINVSKGAYNVAWDWRYSGSGYGYEVKS